MDHHEATVQTGNGWLDIQGEPDLLYVAYLCFLGLVLKTVSDRIGIAFIACWGMSCLDMTRTSAQFPYIDA